MILPMLAMLTLGSMNGINQIALNPIHNIKRADTATAIDQGNLNLPTEIKTLYEATESYTGTEYNYSGLMQNVCSEYQSTGSPVYSAFTYTDKFDAFYNEIKALIDANANIGYIAIQANGINDANRSKYIYYPSNTTPIDSFKIHDESYAILLPVADFADETTAKTTLATFATSCNQAVYGNQYFGFGYATVNKSGVLTDGQTQNLYYYIPNVPTIETIMTSISAVDLFGKEATVSVSDTEKAKYTGKIGVYSVAITAKDTYDQTATATLVIHVIDRDSPTIAMAVGKTLTFVADSGASLKLADLPSYFAISDIGTTYGGTITDPSFTYEGVTFTDKTFRTADIGIRKLGVTVSDSSGNTSTKTFNITVTDATAPVISRKDGSASDTVIKVGLSKTFSLTKAFFLDLFKATDNNDGDVSANLDIEGNYVSEKVGTYPITVIAKDTAGNKASISVTVEVIKDIPPVFILADNLVLTDTATPLTLSEITSVVENGILNEYSVSACMVDSGTYLENTSTAGDYPMTYTASVLNATISEQVVTGDFTLRNVTAEKTSKTGWEKFCDWWSNGFQCLANWWKGLFTKGKFDCWITNEEWNIRFDK